MEVLLTYSNRSDLVDALADLLTRLRDLPEPTSNTESEPPARPVPQTHSLSDEQVRAIFTCYRHGIGPRELARRHGVTERAVKYLLKKHGVQPSRAAWRGVTEGRV